jgi:hypothetical protein
MPAPLVVKHLDGIEQLHLRLAKTGEAISELDLHGREEALDDGIVVVRRSTSCRSSCRCIVCLLVSGNREVDDVMTVPRSRPG